VMRHVRLVARVSARPSRGPSHRLPWRRLLRTGSPLQRQSGPEHLQLDARLQLPDNAATCVHATASAMRPTCANGPGTPDNRGLCELVDRARHRPDRL